MSSKQKQEEYTEKERFGQTVVWYYEEQKELYNSPNEILLPTQIDINLVDKLQRRF